MARFDGPLGLLLINFWPFAVYVTAVILRSPSVLVQQLKLQAIDAFLSVCQHFEVNTSTVPEILVLERFQTTKVTFKSLKVVGIGAIRWATYDFLLVFHINYSVCLYLVPFPKYYHSFTTT